LLCLCGCEKEVGPYSEKGYVNGHFNKGKDFSEEHRKKISEKAKERTGDKNPFYGKKHSEGTKKKLSVSLKKALSINGRRKKISLSRKYSIEKINKKYPLFIKMEEMRYNPDKPGEKEIQVHCKNHNCINSREKGGWFTPTSYQINERLRYLERDGSYFYCSSECKETCPLYRLTFDPYNKTSKLYTEEEYQTFRKFVLERDNYICQFCGENADQIHHERPQKLEPFFALDPDYTLSCCKKCHYEKGHKEECSYWKLASTICN
jgi:hypothetical protein